MPCHGSSLSAAQIEPQSSGKAPALLLSTAWRRRPRRTHRSPVAQQVEQAAVNRWVAGSSPARGANNSSTKSMTYMGGTIYTLSKFVKNQWLLELVRVPRTDSVQRLRIDL